jgi:hypothetical protein
MDTFRYVYKERQSRDKESKVCLIFTNTYITRGQGTSVSIVSDYGLDDRAIGVRFLAGAKDSSSNLSVQNGSEAHLASSTMGAVGPFPGAKRGRGVTLTAHPHLVPRSRMSRSYISSPPSATMTCIGTSLLCFLLLLI